MTDLSPTIIAKSDQLNADDLLGRSLTIRITDVSANPGSAEQPIAVSFDGDNNKPYLPCKSMRRCLVNAWGPDGKTYVGRSITLYRDPKVLWGGVAVGGIRISHMSHIDQAITMALAESKKVRKPFTVQPLKVEAPRVTEPAPPKATNGNGNGSAHRTDEQWRLWLDKLRSAIAVVRTRDEVVEIGGRGTVGTALATGPKWVQREISAILAENFGRFPDEPQADPGDAAALDTEIEIGGEKWAAA